jgi:endophilin-A
VIDKLVDDLRDRTTEYLQPNPGLFGFCFWSIKTLSTLILCVTIQQASRVKLWTVNNFSKIKGQTKNTPYPQPEGTLGETMTKFGADLGVESGFGGALVDMGECLRQMAGIKYALEDNVKQNFLDPLSQIKDTELKDVMV